MSEIGKWFAERMIGKAAAVAVLLLGFAITGLIWQAEMVQVRDEAAARTLERVNAVASRIRQRLVAYEVMLRAGASLFAATDNPTRSQWTAFVDAFGLSKTYPGVQAVGYAARLRSDEIGAFEKGVRAEGFAQFRVWPTGPRAEVGSIHYIEPMSAANVRALGFDLTTDPDRRQAMMATRDTGEPTLTSAVVLLQDAGGGRRLGVLMFLAVYGYGASDGPDAMQTRRQAQRGWVYAAFRPAEMVASLGRGASEPVLVRLYDSASTDPHALLYQDPQLATAKVSSTNTVQVTIEALDRVWTLEGIPAPAAAGAFVITSRSPWTLLAGGLTVSLLLFGVLWSMATTRDRAHTLARSMTLALRRANEELDTRVRQRTADLTAINQQLREEAAERQRVEFERAAALERERERTSQLRALADAGLGLGELRDDEARLEYLADRACHMVGCRHSFLVRADQGAEPTASVASTLPMTFETRRALLDASTRWPTRERIEVVRTMSADSGIAPEAWPEGCSEAMIVPVRLAGGRIPAATLYLLHADDQHFRLEDEVIIHQLVLLVTAAMTTAEAVASERRARMEAEAANNSKDEFLAIVSHELRTPLHAILSWLDVLERNGGIADHLQRAVQVIRRNAEAQSTLIDDLLDLARIEQGKLALELQRVHFDSMVRDTAESLRQSATAKGVVLDVRIEAHGDVYADPVRLQQAVGNLVSNAVKFSLSGGKVALRLRVDEGEFVLDVEDDGEGIETELLPHVFERFTQGDASSRRRKGGLGLGLALVKHIVEAHGGRVSASSLGKGHGAVFTIRMPMLGVEGEVPHVLQRPDEPGAPGDARCHAVLVVDDDRQTREALCQQLIEQGLRVTGCDSAAGALAWLEARGVDQWPDAILCEIGMEERGGYDFYSALRALEARRGVDRRVPVAALTSRGASDQRARALAYGFVAYLSKPISAEHLGRTIERVLGRVAIRNEMRNAQVPLDRPRGKAGQPGADERPGPCADSSAQAGASFSQTPTGER